MDNSKFDFEVDPEFSKNFYDNIEKVLSEGDTYTEDLNSNEYTIKSGDNIDDEIININASLAEQICEEMDNKEDNNHKKHTKFPGAFKVPVGILAGLLLLVGFLGFTKPGNEFLLNMGVNIGGKIWSVWTNDLASDISAAEDIDHLDDEDLNTDGPEADISKIAWPNNSGEGRKEEGVYNILLLGEEAIGSGSGRGRTDVIIIATLNTNTKEIKLTSLMRDLLVKIPGYKENKLNSVYEKDGIDLLYKTISLNFDIHIDGTALVNFENFEKIIDELGGLELTLTSGEARYLNNTNYISNPAYRKVKEGKQLLNGNQVLGYSRVRKRATTTGNNNDYGRTDRHRMILNGIFDKYKTTSKVELASIMLKLLPMVSTDIDDKNFELLLNSFIEMRTMEIQQLRLPADKTFTDTQKVRGMFVLIPDYNKNIDILHDFIFGEENTTISVEEQ
ncbi:MAG: LCP family protein [Clostridiales bacterium]|nr:LCP family protein [Clostridiales bacterium]